MKTTRTTACLKTTAWIIALALLNTDAWAQSEPGLTLPPPASVEEIVTPLELSFTPKPDWPRVTERLKDAHEDAPPFLRDSRLNLHVRSAYFFEEEFDESKKEAWTAGGWVE
ncbi:MAG: hypothetical protein GX443_01340 [Deltaproteobacteria bacterium]|nr:hypothetical protein [Deltaproteobacteria bacterium]